MSAADAELIGRWIAGDDTPEARAAVDRALADAEGAELVARELHFAYALRSAARARMARRTLAGGGVTLVPRRRHGWVTALALAAGLAVAALIWWSAQPERVVTPAHSVAGTVAVSEGVGAWVPGGRYDAMADARLELRADGSVFELAAGSSLRVASLVGGPHVHLEHGMVGVQAARQVGGRTLAVATAHAEVEVVGTRFQVAADAAATTCSVAEGSVRMRSGGSTAVLPAGAAISAGADGFTAGSATFDLIPGSGPRPDQGTVGPGPVFVAAHFPDRFMTHGVQWRQPLELGSGFSLSLRYRIGDAGGPLTVYLHGADGRQYDSTVWKPVVGAWTDLTLGRADFASADDARLPLGESLRVDLIHVRIPHTPTADLQIERVRLTGLDGFPIP
ncbi:MAG TPA: hypothetical protein DCS97_06955 [Planctomycetes bacterium]|nr:hypothetical protein [Planctomycetota bacterium]